MYNSCSLSHIETNDVAIFDSYAHSHTHIHSFTSSLIHSFILSFSNPTLSLSHFFRAESGECERDLMEVAAKIKWKSERAKERKMPRNKGFPWLYYRETKLLVPDLPLHSSAFLLFSLPPYTRAHWLSHRVFIHRKIYILLRLLLSCFAHVHRLVRLIVLNFCFIQSEKFDPS